MHVYIKSGPGLWTVGHYKPEGKFEPYSDHDREDFAAARVAWLNGGGSLDGPELTKVRELIECMPTLKLMIRAHLGRIGRT